MSQTASLYAPSEKDHLIRLQNAAFLPHRPEKKSLPACLVAILARGAAASSTASTTSILALVGILAEGQFLLEFPTQLAVHGDELLADSHKGLARRDSAVGLDAQEHLGNIGVADCCSVLVFEKKRAVLAEGVGRRGLGLLL